MKKMFSLALHDKIEIRGCIVGANNNYLSNISNCEKYEWLAFLGSSSAHTRDHIANLARAYLQSKNDIIIH